MDKIARPTIITSLRFVNIIIFDPYDISYLDTGFICLTSGIYGCVGLYKSSINVTSIWMDRFNALMTPAVTVGPQKIEIYVMLKIANVILGSRLCHTEKPRAYCWRAAEMMCQDYLHRPYLQLRSH